MNTPKALQTVMDFFRRQRLSFLLDPNHPILHASFKGRNASFRSLIAEDESDDFVQVITWVPITVPPDKREAIAELCRRLSCPLKVGHYDMDLNGGDIRFRTYSAHAKGELPQVVISRVLHTNLIMVDQHFPAFVAVLFSNVSAKEASDRLKPEALPKPVPPRETASQPPTRLNLN
jgi:hypothetical protein